MLASVRLGTDWANSTIGKPAAVRRWAVACITNLIFTTATGGALEPRNVLRSYHELLKRAGLERKSLHMLRHTVASVLLQDPDVSVIEVSHLLGHRDATTTLKTYAHFMPHAARAAGKMDDFLAKN